MQWSGVQRSAVQWYLGSIRSSRLAVVWRREKGFLANARAGRRKRQWLAGGMRNESIYTALLRRLLLSDRERRLAAHSPTIDLHQQLLVQASLVPGQGCLKGHL
jgi:hypothetical protein